MESRFILSRQAGQFLVIVHILLSVFIVFAISSAECAPVPDIVSKSISGNSVAIGQSFVVTVVGKNVGDSTASFGGIAVQVRQAYTNGVEVTESHVAVGANYSQSVWWKDDPMQSALDGKADYLHVEPTWDYWYAGREKTLQVTISPKKVGTLDVHCRMYLNTGPGSFSRDPSGSDPSDHSGQATDKIATVTVRPAKATIKSPADRSDNVSINEDIKWNAAEGATSYDVYFGTSNPPPPVKSGYTGTSYDLGQLSYGREYYWRIDSRASTGATTGDVCSFTTEPAPPEPEITHRSNVPSIAEPNVPFVLTVKGKNVGGKTAPYGGIALQVWQAHTNGVELTESYEASGSNGSESVWWRDDPLDSALDGKADYLHIEPTWENWTAGSEKTLNVTITPLKAGTYEVYCKMYVNSSPGVHPRDPDGATPNTDHQGQATYHMGTFTVAKPQITDVSLSRTQVRDGEKFQVGYKIKSDVRTSAWRGCSLYGPSGEEIADSTNEGPGFAFNVEVGEKWYYRDFFLNIPPGAPSGLYDVKWGIHWGTTGEVYYDKYDYLRILDTLPVRVPILMYHKIGSTSHSPYWVTTPMLESQMKALKAYGYTSVSLQDVMDYRAGLKSAPSKPVVLTFDDGYENLLDEAYPVLSKDTIAFPATSFIITNRVGTDNSWDTRDNNPVIPLLDWAQIGSLHSAGMIDFQSHTKTHPHMPTVSAEQAKSELADSKVDIQDHLGKTVRYLCWPYGEGGEDANSRSAARKADYFAAVGAWGGVETTCSDKWNLKRVPIDSSTSVDYKQSSPGDFFFNRIGESIPIPHISINSIEYLDPASGLPLTDNEVYRLGEVKIRVTATNSGQANTVVASLNLDNDSDPNNAFPYDSHAVSPSEDIVRSFGPGTQVFEWTWRVPGDAPTGQYYTALGFHDQHYVLGFAYTDPLWQACLIVRKNEGRPYVWLESPKEFFYQAGEPITIDIRMRNTNYATDSIAYLDVSFPDLQENPVSSVSLLETSPGLTVSIRAKGDLIWAKDGASEVPADYVLVACEKPGMSHDEEAWVKLQVTSPSSGVFHMNYRGTIGDFRYPDSGATDAQQQWHVRVCSFAPSSEDPQPSIMATTGAAPTGTELLWRSVTRDGQQYKLYVLDARPELSQVESYFSGTPYRLVRLYATKQDGSAVENPELVRSLFCEVENAARYWGKARDIAYSGWAQPWTPEGQGFIWQKGQLSRSLSVLEPVYEWTVNDRNKRREAYRRVLIDVVTGMQSGDDAPVDLESALSKGEDYLRGILQVRAPKALEAIVEWRTTLATSSMDAALSKALLQAQNEDIAAAIQSIGNAWDKQREVARLRRFRDNLTRIEGAADAAALGFRLCGKVLHAQVIQAAMNAEAEERLDDLVAFYGSEYAAGNLNDGEVVMEALTEVQSDFADSRQGLWDTWFNIWKHEGNLEKIEDLVILEKGIVGGFSVLFPNSALIQSINECLAPHTWIGTFAAGGILGVYSSIVSISDTMDVLRDADAALVLGKTIDDHCSAYLDPTFSTNSYSAAKLQSNCGLNNIRHLFAYNYFQKTLSVIEARWWDSFLGVISLDPVRGAVGLYSWLGDSQEFVEQARHQRDLALGYYRETCAPAFVSDKRFHEDLPSLAGLPDAAPLTADAVYALAESSFDISFRTSSRKMAGRTFVTLSHSDGLEVVSVPTGWTHYPPGGVPIWDRDDELEPSLVPVDHVYELDRSTWDGSQASIFGIRLNSSAGETEWVRYRVAMTPHGVEPSNSNPDAFVRDPVSGDLDQQHRYAKTCLVHRVTPPVPSVSADVSSLDVRVGEETSFRLTVNNGGGSAEDSYVDISASDNLDIMSVVPSQGWQRYRPGVDKIWHSDGSEALAQDLLLSCYQNIWSLNSSQSFVVKARGLDSGSGWIKYRASMRNGSVSDFVRSPDSGGTDQQGWCALTLPVAVTRNLVPSIDDYSPTSSEVDVVLGNSRDFSVAASDWNGDALTYRWLLGDRLVDEDANFTFAADGLSLGDYTVQVVVSDGRVPVAHVWTVHVVDVERLTVNGIAPNQALNTGVTDICSVAGSGFVSEATVKLSRSGHTDILADNVVFVSSTQLTCQFDLSGEVGGDWDVVVTNPDGQHATLVNGFTVVDSTPQNVSLSPSGKILGTARTTLTSVYTDAAGFADIRKAYLMINDSLAQYNAAFVYYDSTANRLYLKNDANTSWGTGYAPGTDVTVENSQCNIYVKETTVSGSGNDLTVNWRIALKSPFTAKQLNGYMYVQDTHGLKDGWDLMGVYHNVRPEVMSIDPAAGELPAVTPTVFESVYRDPNGCDDIRKCYLLLNDSPGQAGAAMLVYDRLANRVYLKNDAGTAWGTGSAPGTNNVLFNGQCTVYLNETTVNCSGNELTVGWCIGLAAPFAEKALRSHMYVLDNAGLSDGWDIVGTYFTVKNVSLSPQYGALSTVPFTLASTYRHVSGTAAIRKCYLLVNDSLAQSSAVMLVYDRVANRMYLKNDAGTSWDVGYAPGSDMTLENSQCYVYIKDCKAAVADDDLTVSWRMALKAPFVSKNLKGYLFVQDTNGLSDGWDWMGLYHNVKPQVVTITPNSGLLPIDTPTSLVSVYRDPNGFADIRKAYVLLCKNFSQTDAVFIWYDKAVNKVYLKNDTNTSWGTGYAPGTDVVLSNSQCEVYVKHTVVSGFGTDLTINWSFKLKPAMEEANLFSWMYVTDFTGLFDKWTRVGIHFTPLPPTCVSVTPSSGNVRGTTPLLFGTEYSDPNGWYDIAGCYFQLSETSSQANAILLWYDDKADLVYLRNDANTSWGVGQKPGTDTILQNSQCIVYLSNTAVISSGFEGLHIDWSIEMKDSQNNKLLCERMYARDYENLTSGWKVKGYVLVKPTYHLTSLGGSLGSAEPSVVN